uniref:Zinc finger, CCHC-type n=1 Tax=Tanacetum cinerariifolium TaxID=118510 RepID=A0A699I5G1_TANCI|nr:zinc finger, CCHC-type [Tanacetum cinerariifolium]
MAAAAMKHMALNFTKLDKFEGVDFKRWQKKMHFLLCSMSVVYVLTTHIPEDGENATVDQIRRRNKFTQYKMNMDEAIHVSCIIEKISPSWKDFKHTLKHNKEELTLVELGSHLRIEESLMAHDSDKPKGNNIASPLLGHVHFKRMQDMSKDELIHAFDMDTEKCKRGIKCIFVGYNERSKAFRFYVLEPNESVSINSVIESRDAIFDENRFSSVPRPSLRIPDGTEDIGDSVVPKEVTEEVSDQHSYFFNVGDDPNTFDEAMKSHNVTFSKEAINDEMDSIMDNNTWVSADLPLVVCISTIRLLIAMTLIHNLIIHKMDVKITFLDGELDEEVYMNQPQGFIMPGNENKVYKLIKSLYGLKQVPKQWYQKFNEVVLYNGYLLNQADKCVYSKFDESGKGFIICLYVDNMLIFGTGQVQIDLTKKFLSSRFFMKDMGEADVILGIKIKHESNKIAISQSYYIEKVLKKFNYFDCTPVSTPIYTSEKLMPDNNQVVSQLEYSMVIGYLMYVITCIRPDIAFAVGKLTRYTSNHGTQHWQAIHRALKYLKKTMDYNLTYTGYPLVLEGYTDASWISNSEYSSSTSGCVFLLSGGAISWVSKKQTYITGSTIEYEFMALAVAGKEAE